MEALLKIEEREIYPLVEIAKTERTEITETIASLLHEWIEKKVVGMYADGKISLWKAAEIMRVSSCGMIDVLEERGDRIRIERMEPLWRKVKC
jgi:predicted HTH domain antitoxin